MTSAESDTSKPSGSITISDEADYTQQRSVSISLSGNDPDGGVTGYYFSEENTTPLPEAFTNVTSEQVFNTNVSLSLSDGDGTKTVYAWFIDAAGNVSSVSSDSILLDTTAPSEGGVRINDDSGSVSTSLVTVTVSATDSSGIAGYRVSESSATPGAPEDFILLDTPVTSLNKSFSFTLSSSPGIKTLYAWFIDAAGNISSPASSSVDISYGWVRLFRSDMLADLPSEFSSGITTDDSGNIYIVGLTEGDLGGNDNMTVYGSAYVTKLNRTGDFVWTRLLETTDSRTEGTVCSSRGEHITSDKDGNVYISGIYDYHPDFGDLSDAFTAKYDGNGNQLWLKKYIPEWTDDQARVRDIGVDGSNNLYVLGYASGTLEIGETTISSEGSNTGQFLAKYDDAGNLVWVYNITDDIMGDYDARAFTVDAYGNAFVAGGLRDLVLTKFDSNGTHSWSREWGDPEYNEHVSHISMGSSGGLYVSGSYCPDGTVAGSDCGIFVGRFDENGDPDAAGQWSKIQDTLDPSDVGMGSSDGIAVDSENNVYVQGNINLGPDDGADMYILKYSETGTLLWTKRIGSGGGSEIETGNGICTGPGDEVFATGQFANFDPPGFAGQQLRHSTFIWKSGSDSLLDLTLPEGTVTINGGDASTIGNTVTLNLSASDNVGVTGYCVAESDTLPVPSDFTLIEETGTFSADVQHTFETASTGSKTVYVWYRDGFGNFSAAASASIDVTGDVDAPAGEKPVIDGGAEESQSPEISVELSATDNVGVTGYYLTDGHETPSARDFTMIDTPATSFSKTVSYTLTDTEPGPFFIYAWFIDAAGNISEYARAEGVLVLADTTPPETTASPASGFYESRDPITVTLTAEDDNYVLFTYYTVDGKKAHLYSEPFEVTPPAKIGFLSQDLADNVEEAKYVTYGIASSGTVAAGETASETFEVGLGSTLRISFGPESSASTTSFRTASQAGDTILTLKKPDGNTYATYTYQGSEMEILVENAAGGTWTLEIDNSGETTAVDYQANMQEDPFDSSGTSDASLSDNTFYLKFMSGSAPSESGNASFHDIDGNGKIGLPDVIYRLQKLGGKP